jgi:hypothetical protein
MTTTDTYVQSVEFRTTSDGNHPNDWMIIHCAYGDTYQAFLEDGAWWLQFLPGDPSVGPLESSDAVTAWLNTDQ